MVKEGTGLSCTSAMCLESENGKLGNLCISEKKSVLKFSLTFLP